MLRFYFLFKVFPQKSNELLLQMYSSFVHIPILSLIALCNNVSSLFSSRGSLFDFNVFSVTFEFDPRPVSPRVIYALASNLLHRLKTISFLTDVFLWCLFYHLLCFFMSFPQSGQNWIIAFFSTQPIAAKT